MNRFQLREWARYRWEALGRHGMHSPFVYRMVDEALNPPLRRIPELRYRNAAGRNPELRELDGGLLRRLVHYTQVQEIQLADAGGRFPEGGLYLRDLGAPGNPDPGLFRFRRLYLIRHGDDPLAPESWPQAIAALRDELQGDDLLLLPEIYKSPEHVAAWEAVCRSLPYRLSLDFFRLGLLFFRDEFLVPQRIRVKFPI